MSEQLDRYLVDNSALFDLTSTQRASPKFRDIARVPTAVIHEAGDYSRTESLDRLDYPTTASVLEHLKRVMATVEPDDRSLVNLFKYEGTADPLLVACALDANDALAGLMGVCWTVVTGDDAVRGKCDEFGVPWCSAATFGGLLDEAKEQ